MTKRRVLQVFEHDVVRTSGDGRHPLLRGHDADVLERLHQQTNGAYFDLVRHGIKFGQHVGVFQAGDLVVEVLPKAGRHTPSGSVDAWRIFFLQMLMRAGLLPAASVSRTQAHLLNGSLLDVYISHFLQETRALVHAGLTKKYRCKQAQVTSLKGRINFQRQIKLEATGNTAFHVTYQSYEAGHRLNQILAVALDVIAQAKAASFAPELLLETLDAFTTVSRPRLVKSELDNLVFDRKTARYQKAIELARPIIFSLVPSLRSGNDAVLTFMFDMNVVWERYVLAEVRRAAPSFNAKVSSQRQLRFWEGRKLRPDIVVQVGNKTTVLDTKWKALSSAEPSDDDLRQMFAYNGLLTGDRSVLIYPELNGLSGRVGKYWHSHIPGDPGCHECAVCFLKPWEEHNGELRLSSTAVERALLFALARS